LSDDAPAAIRQAVRDALARTRWMVLPLREHPTAPAQGALAIEIPANRDDVASAVGAISHQPTWIAVEREREVLASFGGGCHAAVGATMLVREYGRVLSVRANVNASPQETWSLETGAPPPPPSAASAIWPRPDERDEASRQRLEVDQPSGDEGFWVARADALPENWTISAERLIWAAGTRTWTKLAARGIWVHGCADGLGDTEATDVDRLAGREVAWRRLTHTGTDDPSALATYVVDRPLPPDLDRRTHFFWTSGRVFREAIAAHPALAGAWHGSGPGRTARAIRDNLDSSARVSVWLDYDQWHKTVTR
jgi:hydroxymethylbilane synthase